MHEPAQNEMEMDRKMEELYAFCSREFSNKRDSANRIITECVAKSRAPIYKDKQLQEVKHSVYFTVKKNVPLRSVKEKIMNAFPDAVFEYLHTRDGKRENPRTIYVLR